MVQVPEPVLADVLEHARGGQPYEICGILAGDAGGPRRVEEVFRTENVHDNPRTEYLIDPDEQLDVILAIEDELGLDVVGFYHSHPEGPAHLSSTDRERASWPDAVYFLVWRPGKEGEGFGAWTWQGDDEGFREEPVDVVGEK
jgi:proteasome lid subunit RPN8/RPN11